MVTLNIAITPADDLIDMPRRIIVTGAAPGESVQLSSRTLRAGAAWQSSARFVANATGHVDLSLAPAVDSSYTGISAMGLLWSQKPEQEGRRELFHHDVQQPLVTTLHAHAMSGNTAAADAVLVQRLCADGVARQEVREQGLVGTLFLPPASASAGPSQDSHPAVMILNGSGGGINEPRAALYASRGYAAFALAYFKAPGLSDYISNTALEYFEKSLDWLRAAVEPLNDFVAISGQSRGSELVLLLGATFPEKVSAVLAYVPSALVHSGQNACDPAIGREGPTWLLNGKPLTHQWENNRYARWAPFDAGAPPQRHALTMQTALQDKEAVAKARIQVEKIQAPVLLFSATDDGSWPSSVYAKMVSDKLKEVVHPYAVEWHDYLDAGHAILFPYVPTTQISYAHPDSKRISTGGGKPAANAHADHHAWQHAQQFLKNAIAVKQGQAIFTRKEIS